MELFGRDKHFYHGSVRRYVALFGSLFSNLYIVRESETKEEYIKVPIRYGTGNMYLKVPQDKSRENQQISRVLPAMAFELENIYKDVNRKTNPMNRIQASTFMAHADMDTKAFQFNRVPYNFIFKLMIRTKNSDDMMQIAEQIIPAFDGNLSVTIADTTGVDVEQDIIISIQELDIEDNYDNEMQSRLVEWTITFEVRGFLYKRTLVSPIIREIDLQEIDGWGNVVSSETIDDQGDIQDEQLILSDFTQILESLPKE